MEIMKILNCAVEAALPLLFIALLSRGSIKKALVIIPITAAVGYLFVGAVLPIKVLVLLAIMITGSLIV